jgi:OmcA/MtrC family decaheme c-type cytochrome
VPQDGITAPADFNVSVSGWLKKIWNGTATGAGAGTLSAPDGSGYYTLTLTGVTVPDSAVMLTGGLGYTYNVTSTLPLTQTNLSDYPVTASTVVPAQPNKQGGLIVIAPNVQKVGSAGCIGGAALGCTSTGGYTGRRAIVEDARCNACHQELGTFTEDAFHAGQRNDGTTCSWCHRPNQTSSGWSADSTAFVHAIHGSAKRKNPFTWHASSTTEGFWDVTYPGVLSDCETCHLPGTYDFSAATSAAAADNRLFRTVGTGRYALKAGDTTTTYSGAGCTAGTSAAQTALGAFSMSPFIATASNNVSDISFGVGFSFNAGLTPATGCTPEGTPYSIPAGGTLPADGKTLVISPTSTVCSACHDSADAISHFKINGAAFYQARSTALTGTNETCLICHGTGRLADIAVVHPK